MSVEIDNVDGVIEALSSVLDERRFMAAMRKSCALVERTAKINLSPTRGDGALGRSITSSVMKDGNNILGIVFTPLEYAPYVEFGTGLFAVNGGRKDVPWCYQDDEGEWHTTSGQHPKPFLEPALNESRAAIIEYFRRASNND